MAEMMKNCPPPAKGDRKHKLKAKAAKELAQGQSGKSLPPWMVKK